MNWKKQLQDLEQAKDWNAAITFMESLIDEHPENMEAYLCMNYLLANLITDERDWDINDEDKFNFFTHLFKKYFDESYIKFSDNAEYLFFTAQTYSIVDWCVGKGNKDYMPLFEKAIALDPDNLFYKQVYLQHIWGSSPMKEPRDIEFAKKVLAQDPSIKKIFDEKGALGERIWWNLIYNSRAVLGLPKYSEEEMASWK